MSEFLGLIDTLEAAILEAKRIPFSKKIVIDEKQLLTLIDKLRFLVRHRDAARKAVDLSGSDPIVEHTDNEKNQSLTTTNEEPEKLIVEAKRQALIFKKGANEYADNVLARLQLLITKLQKNMIRLEKNIDDGRATIEEVQKRQQEKEETKDMVPNTLHHPS